MKTMSTNAVPFLGPGIPLSGSAAVPLYGTAVTFLRQASGRVRSLFAQRLDIHMASSPHPSAICHQIADSLLGPASAHKEDLLSDELREPTRSSFFFWRHTILKNYRDMDVRRNPAGQA